VLVVPIADLLEEKTTVGFVTWEVQKSRDMPGGCLRRADRYGVVDASSWSIIGRRISV